MPGKWRLTPNTLWPPLTRDSDGAARSGRRTEGYQGLFRLASRIPVWYGTYTPRVARVIVPGVPHHVIERSSRRGEALLHDAECRVERGFVADWRRRHGVEGGTSA